MENSIFPKCLKDDNLLRDAFYNCSRKMLQNEKKMNKPPKHNFEKLDVASQMLCGDAKYGICNPNKNPKGDSPDQKEPKTSGFAQMSKNSRSLGNSPVKCLFLMNSEISSNKNLIFKHKSPKKNSRPRVHRLEFWKSLRSKKIRKNRQSESSLKPAKKEFVYRTPEKKTKKKSIRISNLRKKRIPRRPALAFGKGLDYSPSNNWRQIKSDLFQNCLDILRLEKPEPLFPFQQWSGFNASNKKTGTADSKILNRNIVEYSQTWNAKVVLDFFESSTAQSTLNKGLCNGAGDVRKCSGFLRFEEASSGFHGRSRNSN